MAAKRMLAVRLDPHLIEAIDRQRGAGETRTEWVTRAVARAALQGAGRPQGPVDGCGEPRPIKPNPGRASERSATLHGGVERPNPTRVTRYPGH